MLAITFHVKKSHSIFMEQEGVQGPRAESFYYVNYGLSIITLKVRQIISVMKT